MTLKTNFTPGEPTWVERATPNMDIPVSFSSSLIGWACATASAWV